MIGSSISHYKILEKLGEGGMGVVYRAEDTKLERPVALKFLPAHLLGNEDVRKRFEREAKSAAVLDHPNVCHVYEIDEADDKTFIAMSLIEGVSLDQKIAQGPLKLDEALSIAQQIAKGLEAAHKRGIIHRDVKPENIMVSDDGHVTIMDFGLAQLTEASRLTKTDETVGTVAYMSPEQTDGSGTDHRTDIWSLGVVLYEMVTGQQPFKGDYDKAVMYSILNEAPEPITGLRSGVPIQLEDYIGKCLAKEKSDRYQDLSHLVLDLKGLQRQVESGRSRVMAAAKPQPGPEPAVQQSVGTSRIPWAVAILLGLVAVGLALLLLNQPQPDRPVRRFSFTPDSLADRFAAAVSPDGKQIVYVSGDTPPALWVRSLDDESPRKLAGTEGVETGPFWSPDSKMIAFAADGAIKKIPAVGGTATVLCDYFGGFTGGAWSPDGQSLVVSFGNAVTWLRSVPASGGELKDLFETRARGEKGASNLEPHFLPSAQSAGSMLFTAGVSENRDVFLLNGRTGETQLLFEGAAPFYSEGYIIYLPQALQPGLWAVPFSLETLSVTGEAFPLAEGVEGAGAATDGTLVTMDRDAPAGQVLVWRDRRGKKLAEIGRTLERIRSLELSPDGAKVAAQGSDGGDRELWIHDADRQVAQKLTFGDQSPRFPAWSPDGGTLIYSEVSDGLRVLFEIPADGGGTARQIIEAPKDAMEMYPSWSRDGRYIVYAYGGERSSGRDLWLIDRGIDEAAGQARPFLEAPFNQSTPQISPDSTLVAYTSNETGVDEVYVRGLPDGALQVQVSENGGGQPRWSHDGKELFFTRGQDLMVVDVSMDPELRIGAEERLFSVPDLDRGLGYNYDVAPDGRFLMIDSVATGDDEARESAIHITQNWAEEFRDR